MKQFSKALAVFINLANYAVGIAVTVILLFKLDYLSVFFINGMTSNEGLFFNMAIFIIALALIGIVLNMLVDEYDKKDMTFQFPLVFEILPIIISVINIIYAFKGETTREKLIVIAVSLLYSALSLVTIYCGSRVFQIYPKENK
ncbi:MAG: hypothetical protein IJT65_00690 [Eubacterium sp.]|nr:hypothetical protein [Eubacterium sp.]